MSYKVKSLVYFVCFLVSAFAYYNVANTNNLKNDDNKKVAELNMERITFDKTTEL